MEVEVVGKRTWVDGIPDLSGNKEAILQVQENDGRYRKPEELDARRLEEVLKDACVKRIVVFPVYDANGKPSAEVRRAWRRWRRTGK